MVIDKIYIQGFAAIETKDNAPIGPDGNGEKPLQFPFKWMPMKSRQIHGLNFLGGLQGRENKPDPLHHIWRQLAAVVMLKQPLQAFVPKFADH